VGETFSWNIGTPKPPKDVKIDAQCYDDEKFKFSKLFGEFQDFYAWSYEDLHGFDPHPIKHVISLKKGIKSVRKKQGPIDLALKVIIQRELENCLKAGITFPIKCPGWISKLVLAPKVTGHISFCINFRTFCQDIMKNPPPSPNMEIILL
jgi:hypothetical protein